MKRLEKIVLVLIIILLAAGIYVGIRNIGLFNVKEIGVSVSGPVTNVSTDMQRLLTPLKGRNIFEINLRSLKKQLESFDGVKSVKISRYYPDRLDVSVEYSQLALKAYTVGEDGVKYYFIHDCELEQIAVSTWEAFDQLAAVELNPAYAQMTLKWGADKGFSYMVAMTENLGSNNLITSMKYDNNNGNDFGRLAISLSSINAMLYVREPVSPNRLAEAMDIISGQASAVGAVVVYDLYANTLVKRT